MIIYIITILCYAPSVFTCIVGGAIQMTVYIYIYIYIYNINPVQWIVHRWHVLLKRHCIICGQKCVTL